MKEPISIEEEKINIENGEKTFFQEQDKREKEINNQELLSKKELEKKILTVKLSPKLTDDAKKTAVQIKPLNKKEKLQNLLNIAEEKGVAFAVAVVKNMNDHYLLDTFHDFLVKDGLYKKFKK